MKTIDIDHYRGERGRRGNKLPRGLQRVDHVEIELSNANIAQETEQELANNKDITPTEES